MRFVKGLRNWHDVIMVVGDLNERVGGEIEEEKGPWVPKSLDASVTTVREVLTCVWKIPLFKYSTIHKST